MAGKAYMQSKGLLSYFTRHATIANLLLVVLIAAGLTALPRMKSQFFPDVIVDTVRVSVTWDGAGAEDVDTAIMQILEPALLAVEGVASTSSSSSEGRASVRMEFEPGWDMARAADDVQGAVDALGNLPADADDPTVSRGNWRDPVTDVIITGPVAVAQLANFADEFVIELFAEGVTRATIQGVAAPNIIVEVASVDLIRHDITMREISAAIAEEVSADPAGDVVGANARVTTGVEKRSAEQIEAVVLRLEANGSQLTVGDVASVRSEGVDRNVSFFVGDNSAIRINVQRSQSGDAIAIQDTVEKIAAEMVLSLPEGVSIDLVNTRSEMIKARLDILVENGLQGLVLVVILLFLFLNARTAFWVAAGIPVAMLGTVALMYLAGLSFNMISLFALIITLGIVVDDAIVVGEHADFRARRLGEPPVVAAERAAKRMSLPVFSATLTTIIAFFALTSIGGRFGSLIDDIPFTVIVVLTASLVECFLILPNHMSHALVHTAKEHWYDWPSRVVNIGFRWFRDVIFRRFMSLVVLFRYPVIAGVILLLTIQINGIMTGKIAWRFFNAPEQGSVVGNFAMYEGATRDDTLAMMREMQRAVEEVGLALEQEHGTNPVIYVTAQIGGNAGRGLATAGDRSADLLGSISVEIIDADLRPYSSFAFAADLQAAVRQVPKTETISFRGGRAGPGGDSLDVQLLGVNSDALKAASNALQDALAQYPEVSAVEDNLAYDKEELILELTPQGQVLGFTIDALGRTLRERLGGIEAAFYPLGGRSASIRVELPEGELTADFLERTQMRKPGGGYVPLADIVTVSSRTGFSTVLRENGVRLISVTGDIDEENAERATEIQEALETTILPEIAERYQVDWRMSGLAEQEQSFLNDALTGLILCLLGIYLVLCWVFQSWTRPIVVMSVIPFGLIGAIYGHGVMGVPLSMFSVVGLLGMTGIIINDSIVLVTTIDEYAEDRGLLPSIIDGAADRLRPVLLTTMTTILGLWPLLNEGSAQAEFLKPTVITLVYGLGFGMVLVLLVVPSFIAIQRDVRTEFVALKRMMSTGARARGPRTVVQVAAFASLAWGLVTMGSVIADGAMPTGLIALVPSLERIDSLPMAFAAFLAGVLGVVLLTLIAGMILIRPKRRSA
ncbi:MAG: efflux RND transporter permease subunit [Paracoccaceae bacterium]|jgi:multidrug efflux pump subunit AcrB|nr:efflux RND transporter permease subunit [Paracoccaceae bacterium]MDP7185990.1 efflux RND transporter permease subunit [Paracoccaceae bacterium]